MQFVHTNWSLKSLWKNARIKSRGNINSWYYCLYISASPHTLKKKCAIRIVVSVTDNFSVSRKISCSCDSRLERKDTRRLPDNEIPFEILYPISLIRYLYFFSFIKQYSRELDIVRLQKVCEGLQKYNLDCIGEITIYYGLVAWNVGLLCS